MRKFFASVLIWGLVLSFSACGRDVLLEGQYYDIYLEDGNYMVSFKNLVSGESGSRNYSVLVEFPKFNTVGEMFDTIASGKITMDDINRMGLTGSNTFEIIDLNKPLDMQLPDNTYVNHITWYLDSYSFTLESSIFENGSIYCYDQEEYEEIFQSRYTEYFNEYHTIHSTTTIDDRNATEFLYSSSTGEYKLLRYQITDGDRILYIEEMFLLSHTNPDLLLSPILDGVPHRIEIFGEENNTYFYAYLGGFSERPSVEWLSSFGLTPLEDSGTDEIASE